MTLPFIYNIENLCK